ncbi:MAG TPA: HNH endonuclease signature motif containing protein [Candidatus Eisenbacteria bacterium]|nr:HNH endonuclease signature motif containing protein [Candidatus Eisenbacteria bacterium]
MHWIHGGSTDLSNLILLCHRHHGPVAEWLGQPGFSRPMATVRVSGSGATSRLESQQRTRESSVKGSMRSFSRWQEPPFRSAVAAAELRAA